MYYHLVALPRTITLIVSVTSKGHICKTLLATRPNVRGFLSSLYLLQLGMECNEVSVFNTQIFVIV